MPAMTPRRPPDRRVWPGSPAPLGATWDGEGVNFALFSRNATSVELCLFGEGGDEERIRMAERTDWVWHTYLPDARPGQRYGYRVDGPFAPGDGHRFNPHKLLLDPYARLVSEPYELSESAFGFRFGDTLDDRTFSSADSGPQVAKGVLADPAFSWSDDRRPRTPWNRTVIYECHVKGMTARHPHVAQGIRGTYLGLAAEPVIDHLLGLGVTAVELLPVHQAVTGWHLVSRGLTEYWGYNTIGFFAPEVRYATHPGRQIYEFKTMVKALHRAGLEVILDVVYNHTGEGGVLGPTLSFRGIDNAAYYHLNPADRRFYDDVTGTGNTLNAASPRVLQLILDSLRYWAGEMHVDGFRFDLAPALARGPHGLELAGPLYEAIGQDPLLAGVKLIAEPWDVGYAGYQLGNFPAGWAEWNDKYRDCIRRFWRGESGQVPELASRLAGSSDLFAPSGRGTYASINFITAHDGFTLADLVSYEQKHNEANGEDNHDGTDDNLSRNWGAEGPTESAWTNRMRDRMKRNLLATLLLSQGVPMLVGGDEMGRSQGGNNNAYCQDNATSWLSWDLNAEDRRLIEFTAQAIEQFRANPVLRRRKFFTGEAPNPGPGAKANGSGAWSKDLVWLRPDGKEMSIADWGDAANQVLGMLIPGSSSDDVDDRGRPLFGETMLLALNGGSRTRYFVLPGGRPGGPAPRARAASAASAARAGGPARALAPQGAWEELLNTAHPGQSRLVRTPAINLVAFSLVLLRLREQH